MNVMPNKVKNYILINYEDLLYNYDKTLQLIKDKFDLIQKTPEFIKIKKYKKSETYNFVKQREITFGFKLIQLIWKNLNLEQEKKLGYLQFNNNIFFKKTFEEPL